MMNDYFYRPYQIDDEEEIVQLLELLFDGWPHFDLSCTSLDHWRWKYNDNPFNMKIIAICEINRKIVGAAHSYPLNIKIGDEIRFCTFGGDTGVHPNHRRKGIHTKVSGLNDIRKKEAGSQYHYLSTGNPIIIKQFSKTRKLLPYKTSTLTRIRNIRLHLKLNPIEKPWLMNLGFNVAKLYNHLENIFTPDKSKNQSHLVSRISRFDKRINDFWKEVSEHYGFIVERNQDYLNWRYCDPRGGNYIINIAEEDGQILGYSVLRINRYRKEYPIGSIVDILTLPERSDAANALMTDAVKFFDSENVNIIKSLVVKNHPIERIQKIHGFLDSRKSPHIFYLPYGEDDELNRLDTDHPSKAAHFVYGDLDAI